MLVIIGLIVGGVVTGRDLIKAAEARAQISKIEKYQTAVNTFRAKYNNYLPGDIKDPDASSFAFRARGTLCGQGDGDGMLLGINNAPTGCSSSLQAAGETAMFWVDLSMAHLIDGTFSIAVSNALPGTGAISMLETAAPFTQDSAGNFNKRLARKSNSASASS